MWLRWDLIGFLAYVAALVKEEQEGQWENTPEAWLRKVYSRQEGVLHESNPQDHYVGSLYEGSGSLSPL
jgi:hypothetical protein